MGSNFLTILCLVLQLFRITAGRSDSGKIDFVFNANSKIFRDQRPLLSNTKIYVNMECVAESPVQVAVSWSLASHRCWVAEYIDTQIVQNVSKEFAIIRSVEDVSECVLENHAIVNFPDAIPTVDNAPIAVTHENTEKLVQTEANREKREGDSIAHKIKEIQRLKSPGQKLIHTTIQDGIYEFTLNVRSGLDSKFTAVAHIDYLGPHGYISATDWPLLPFYGVMCVVYVVYGLVWLIVSFMQWRDLLRIQFWIGGVIFLGMLEKAFFYAQYHSLNTTGKPVQVSELPAEFVSCAKRTLARMLVIIMSLGFGIVKPRLGPMLHRVVGVGALYFILACVESYLRVTHVPPDDRNELLVASIPLAVLDTGICWWIFTSLVQTTRTLRLRRNMVKLSLYRHFTNTLIFAVFASVIFMLFAMRLRKTENCTPGWRDIWVDTAFWHILFSVLLLVIMILWRPTNNNQRYAFTPLLDNPEDEDDEEEDQFVADAYGVKIRQTHAQMNGGGTKTPPNSHRAGATTTEDDDLRWVEENIPSSIAEPTLPILDSDEDIINTKFEVSKMQ